MITVSEDYGVDFVTEFIPKEMLDELEEYKNKLFNVSFQLGFDAYKALQVIFSNMRVDTKNGMITLEPDSRKRYMGYDLDRLLRLITFGGLGEIRCDAYLQICDNIVKSIGALHLEYLGGY